MAHQPAISTLGNTAARDFIAAVPSDNAQAFRRAMRHSRHVRLLRVAVPVFLVLVVGGFSLAAWLDPLRLLKRLPGDFAGIAVSGTKITMAAPKLSGYTRDYRRYEFTARSAGQDITKPDIVELYFIHAKIEMQDKSELNVTADEGVLDRKSGILTLKRNIVLLSSSGLDVRLSEALVDTANGDIVSSKPVELRSPQGTLNANRLEVSQGGDLVRFEEGVTMLLAGEGAEAGKDSGAKP
jgi:lipopolysaccharide export system protein LptC